jgi:hypothetical protein
MREDMFKVIVERPRWGRRNAGKLRMPRDDRGYLSFARSGKSKGLNENLNPLVRFIRGKVGRPWNQVHAEISAHLNVRSAVQKHVLDHLSDIVALHVFEEGGKLWSTRRAYGVRVLEARHSDVLYVCPRTGYLRQLKHKKRQRRVELKQDIAPV